MPGMPSGENHSSDSQTCGRKRMPLWREFVVEPLHVVAQPGAAQRQAQVAEPQVEQGLVVEPRPRGLTVEACASRHSHPARRSTTFSTASRAQHRVARCDAPCERAARAAAGSASQIRAARRTACRPVRHRAPRRPCHRARRLDRGVEIRGLPAQCGALERALQYAPGHRGGSRRASSCATARTSLAQRPRLPDEGGGRVTPSQPCSGGLRPATRTTTSPRTAGTRRESTGDWCVVRAALGGQRDRGGRIAPASKRRGGEHARQAGRGRVTRIMRSRHRQTAPEIRRERLRHVRCHVRLARRAVRRTVALALPAQVPLDLVARIAAAHVEQAVGEAQRQRRGLRPGERHAGPRRDTRCLARRAHRPAPGHTRHRAIVARARSAGRVSALPRPVSCARSSGPSQSQHVLRPARPSPVRAASIATAPLAARARSVLPAHAHRCPRFSASQQPAASGAATDAGATVQIDVVPDRRARRRASPTMRAICSRLGGHAVVDDRFAQVFRRGVPLGVSTAAAPRTPAFRRARSGR